MCLNGSDSFQSPGGIKRFQDMGYRIVIVTNQPGIGIGYFSKEDFYRVNRAMLTGFSKAGILVDKIYFCPHSKSEKCECRKPGQALIRRAQDELNLDLANSVHDRRQNRPIWKRASGPDMQHDSRQDGIQRGGRRVRRQAGHCGGRSPRRGKKSS